MSHLKYFVKGFGYTNVPDFLSTTFSMFFLKKAGYWFSFTLVFGTIQTLVSDYLGLKWPVFVALVWLICAETYTGIKVARKVRKERFKSRKFGRMLLKVGTYVQILYVLHSFTHQLEVPDIWGISISPFSWLYHCFLVGVVLQFFISWQENLGALGYKESGKLAGFFLRNFNKWFEFDGSKDNGEE